MTVITRPEGERRASEILEQAEEQYREVLEDLKSVRMALRDRSDLAEGEIRRVLTEFRRVAQTVFDERKRLEELRKRRCGIVHDYALDFDALRGEIGSRLDRLRDAGAAGTFPG
ncbi:hypothetical protein [Profundibacterium mesophilum]|uniref:Uncharacterized protein n=1 Tax=Profundibacterium mesophilum KAUST100406-0324 TaxID=1037889 RepID=A0A921NZA6_9RHOB|nr:hypothetical protein [Profundibacterium mesophilum]KAF0677409.1 hypothetical protein PMES_00195 [Profundibacterium mesophilum KAUST100406-0324]